MKRLVRENGPLPADEAFDAAIQVAEGLQAIHDEGIVHRDLKPANMIRDAKGVVRLLDFGIAQQVDATTTEGLTSTGVVVGTPDYISPEQALGKKADARSDICSLGVVVFHGNRSEPTTLGEIPPCQRSSKLTKAGTPISLPWPVHTLARPLTDVRPGE